jgi:hypothetical protein
VEQAEPNSPLKYLSGRNYSIQNLSQFSERNNVPDSPAFNTDEILSKLHAFHQLI